MGASWKCPRRKRQVVACPRTRQRLGVRQASAALYWHWSEVRSRRTAAKAAEGWSLTVSLHETHLPGSLLRLEWNDSSMILENAPTPSGPWTALPFFASGQNINISSTGSFFRLKRLPE